MKHRGMKILAMLLTLVMLVGLVPGMSLTAYAEASIGGTEIDVYRGSGTVSSDMTCTYFSVFNSSTLTINQGVTVTLNNPGWYFNFFDESKIELHGTLAGSAGSGATWMDRSYINVYLSDGAKYTVTGLSCMDGDSYLVYYGYDAATDGNGTVSVKNGSTDVTSASKGYKTTTYTFTATPSDGYKFKNWTKGPGGEVLGADASINVTCEQNGQYQVYANFEADAPTTYTVTYKVVNGTWADGTTTDKTETVASGAKPVNVPTGMIASTGYTGGAWSPNPADTTITEATTFTYTFGAIPTFTVTYRVVNGTWADGTTADKTETVASGAKPANVPTGMIPSAGYTGGAWSPNPADTTITEATTFTYTFGAIPTFTVTYRVVNGTWADGTTADKTETVTSGAKPANVPTGMKPTSGYTGGAWDKNPADATITEATIFTYIFTATPTFNVTVSETPNGTVTASKTTATAGENITLTITPASGYQIQATTVTDVNNNNIPVSNNSFTMPAADVTVTVTFIQIPVSTYTVTVANTPNGTVTASKTTAAAGENITLTITPASGYQVQAITVTDVNNNNISVTNNSFTMPAANVFVTVTFIESPVQPTTFTVSFFANGGGGVMNPVTVPANSSYTLPACSFTPPAGKQFKAWQLGSTEFAPGSAIIVDSNAEFVAIWKDDDGSGESGHGGITGDIVFIGGGYGGADEWYDGGYAPQRAWKVKLAPMVNGSAALGIMTGESTTTDMNVYPTTTIYVFPNANPGFVLDKIIWSYIDGTASYDITEAKNFVMPAMDVVVYVTFKPAG